MNIKTFLTVFIVLIIQGCNFSTSNFEKDQSIDTSLRQEIKTLNNKLFSGITSNNFGTIQPIMSPGLLEKFNSDSNKFINQISILKFNSYNILDEYFVQASSAGTSVTVLSGNDDDNHYAFTFECVNKDSYVSLLLLNSTDNQFLLAAVYGKYQNEWKLNILKLGQYSCFGKTALDYYHLAKSDYKKMYLIDAADDISISEACLQPAGTLLHFIKEKEISDFRDSVLREANIKYELPLTLANIDSRPKVFRIFPQRTQEGFSPTVYYTTVINLDDTIALKLENQKIRKDVDSIFTGIDKDKKFISYGAFNKLPDEQGRGHGYGFIDTLTNR